MIARRRAAAVSERKTQKLSGKPVPSRPVLMRCCLRLRRRKKKKHPARVAPSLARRLFEGRSLGLEAQLWRLVPPTPIVRLGHSLRSEIGGRRVLLRRRSWRHFRRYAPHADVRLLPCFAASEKKCLTPCEGRAIKLGRVIFLGSESRGDSGDAFSAVSL